MSENVRVLIVDDSPTVRRVLRRVLERTAGLQVIGEAADGEDGVRMTLELGPDAILMDLDMPRMDGYQAIEELRRRRPTPIVVVTARQERDQMRAAFQTMRRGVIAVLPKPETPEGWPELEHALVQTLLHVGRHEEQVAANFRQVPAAVPRRHLRVLAVGASTGGPAAVRELLAGLGHGIGAGVVVVQHISAGFELGLVDWLAHELEMDVALADDDELLRPGTVRVAPPEAHLRVDAGGRLHLDRQKPPRSGHRPSVDELFLSLADTMPRSVGGALLTGMGRDGASGLLALRQGGGLTAVQEAGSCAVFGMPRAALEMGAAELSLPPVEIGRLFRASCVSPLEGVS